MQSPYLTYFSVLRVVNVVKVLQAIVAVRLDISFKIHESPPRADRPRRLWVTEPRHMVMLRLRGSYDPRPNRCPNEVLFIVKLREARWSNPNENVLSTAGDVYISLFLEPVPVLQLNCSTKHWQCRLDL